MGARLGPCACGRKALGGGGCAEFATENRSREGKIEITRLDSNQSHKPAPPPPLRDFPSKSTDAPHSPSPLMGPIRSSRSPGCEKEGNVGEGHLLLSQRRRDQMLPHPPSVGCALSSAPWTPHTPPQPRHLDFSSQSLVGCYLWLVVPRAMPGCWW